MRRPRSAFSQWQRQGTLYVWYPSSWVLVTFRPRAALDWARIVALALSVVWLIGRVVS